MAIVEIVFRVSMLIALLLAVIYSLFIAKLWPLYVFGGAFVGLSLLYVVLSLAAKKMREKPK